VALFLFHLSVIVHCWPSCCFASAAPPVQSSRKTVEVVLVAGADAGKNREKLGGDPSKHGRLLVYVAFVAVCSQMNRVRLVDFWKYFA